MALRKDIEIPYALRAGMIVHVSEVARGLDYGCVCDRCGDALVARKGASRQHHFAHYSNSDCSGAAESLLTSASKGAAVECFGPRFALIQLSSKV
jgi:hypothetical protein